MNQTFNLTKITIYLNPNINFIFELPENLSYYIEQCVLNFNAHTTHLAILLNDDSDFVDLGLEILSF